jgi:L-amino acid N-acyltransferase YncA
MKLKFEPMVESDWAAVAAIYSEGIATGHATFAGAPPKSWESFCKGKLMVCAGVARAESEVEGVKGEVLGWGTLAAVSDRCVYAGVAEVSVYVATAARGRGVGAGLLRDLIARAEAAGVWTLIAGIFPENVASVTLHERVGFRVVGRRERLGKMPMIGPRAGEWRDVLLLERRSAVVGV